MDIPKITTFLMFNDEAEEAIQLYTSLFEDSEFREFAWVQDKFGVSFQLALPENK